MELSDCPHAVGTPEHSEWVKYTYIPAVNAAKMAEHGPLYGAESIGGRRIDGNTHNPDGTPRTDVGFIDGGRLDLGLIRQQADLYRNSFQWSAGGTINGQFFVTDPEAWKALFGEPMTDLSQVDRRARPKSRAERRAKVKKPTRPRRGPVKPNSARQCPRHGGPAESCKFCRR